LYAPPTPSGKGLSPVSFMRDFLHFFFVFFLIFIYSYFLLLNL
jgi:hypothetical protein